MTLKTKINPYTMLYGWDCGIIDNYIITTTMCKQNNFYYIMCIETCSCKHNMTPFPSLGPQIFNWGPPRYQCALKCFIQWIVGHFPACTSGTDFNVLVNTCSDWFTMCISIWFLEAQCFVGNILCQYGLWILHFLACRITIGFMYQSQEPWRNLWKFLGACTRYRVMIFAWFHSVCILFSFYHSSASGWC